MIMYFKGWRIIIEDEVASATKLGGRVRMCGLVKNVLPRLQGVP